MGKRFLRNIAFLTLFTIFSQFLFPFASVLANTNSSILPPSDLGAIHLTPDDVRLTWGSVVGATGYNVYEITEGQLILHGKTTANIYNLNDLAEGSYRFVVSTLSSNGESGPSAPVSFTVTYPQMAEPGNFTQSIRNGNDIVLNWGASQYAEHYNVYRILNGNEKSLLASVTTRTFTVTNAPEGQYTYAVSAVNTLYGESALSKYLDIEVIHPIMTAPSNFTYSVTNGSDLTLKWGSVPFATNYNVYQLKDGKRVLINTVTATTLKFTNVPTGEYIYEVTANSTRFGESVEGSRLNATVSDITMVAPSNINYTLQNINDIVLTWNTVPHANSYKVYQIVDGEKVLRSTVTSTTVRFNNSPSGSYVYEVHSYSDRFGESEDSSQITVTVEGHTMSAPSNFTYKVQNGNDIVLSWNGVANANNYRVYQIVNGEKILRSTITGTSVTYSNRPEGEYQYEVSAFSTRFGESESSGILAFSVVHPTMEPPANLIHAVNSATQFTLSWDVAPHATSYKVYQVVDGQKVLRTTTSNRNVTYSSMAPGEYTYLVHAVSNRFGESSVGTQVKVTLNGQTMATPTNFTYSILNGNDISLRWTSVQYANSYRVYQVINGEKVLSRTVTGTTVTIANAPAGEYQYIVHSVSSLLGESPEGAEVAISLVHPVMEAPSNFTSRVQNGNDVVLTWSSVPFANNYKIYEVINGVLELRRTVTTLSTTLSNESEGEHTYVVHSLSSRFGESVEGSQIAQVVVFPIMEKPSNLTIKVNNGNDLALSWSAVSFANNYNVYREIDGKLVFQRTVTATSTTFTNQPEGDYKYVIKSNSTRYGESLEGSNVSLTLAHPVMERPENFTSSITNGNDIVLRWNAATFATAYKVYRVVDGNAVLERTVTGTSTTFVNMPEGDYQYIVHSVSSRFGDSPEGSSLNLTLTWPVVLAPVVSKNVFNANNITFTWPIVTWANEYRVYRIINDTRQLLYKGTARSFTVNNLTEDTHQFEVTAFSTRFGESQPARVTETIIYPIMQPPVAKLTLLSDTSARISWDFITYANGYNIYELINGVPVLVAEKVNNLSYTITNMSYADHEYYVTSYSNSFGESSQSNIVLAKLIVDTEAPVTTVNAPQDWTNQAVVATLSATDNETGVADTFYSINNSAFVKGTTFTLDKEGIHKISFYSIDKVGNVEKIKTSEVNIDKTAPITSAVIQSSWSKEAVSVELTAVDKLSGVAKTFYSINGSELKEGTSFTVTEEGISLITFFSIDKAGNVEDQKTVVVKIDKTAPVTSADASSTWSKESVNVKLTVEDKLSGPAQTFYSINGSMLKEGISFDVIEEGVNKVSFFSIDKAGNVEDQQTIEVKIDKTAPVTNADVPSTWSKEPVNVELTVEDKLSGVAKTFYSINGSALREGTSFSVPEEGVNLITFFSTDRAGNIEDQQTVVVKIDKTAPNVVLDLNDSYQLETVVNLSYSAHDNLSGIQSEVLLVNGVQFDNGDMFSFDKPGSYSIKLTVIDHAGWSTTLEKTINVYIPIEIKVNPGVINPNTGKFTVQVVFTKEFEKEFGKKHIKELLKSFDLTSVTLNGVSAIAEKNGDQKKSENGLFKFNREDFNWVAGETLVEFRGMLGDYQVVGYETVKVLSNNKR
ncbi:MAG: OmpL47-type beta-barrel domain-containing protein [Anaerobacillus sp.]|uniref:OmpL47-type beta-barrel domain-containing protein n=1 Tax=Anaerobacillus sp. TaxID=1872506 RepID=UPI00391911D9